MAQQRSAKRGVCWDEKTQPLTDALAGKMASGVSWFYNWGVAPVGDASLQFLPMCWNGSFDETQLRQYLTQHQDEDRYLLAFNEPNLSWTVGGSQMTPQQAADAWPRVEQVARDFGLELVAPALNFTGDVVGDRIWEPFAWYDEFFRLVPDAGVDYLCFHSYMNYFSAVNWVASEYFYTDREESDLFYPANRTKYPHLVKYLEDYKTATGHFPRMFLTEFCSYQANEYPYRSAITLDFQIDQMTQKVQKLEQSDLVAGYAWFMGNISGGAAAWPYMSIFQANTPASDLSVLGQVYVHMSSFDRSKYYAPGEVIMAKDYIDASTDEQAPHIRPNTEPGSDIPLQVEWPTSGFTAYQVEVPAADTYQLTLHVNSTAAGGFRVYRNTVNSAGRLLSTTLPSTSGLWQDVALQLQLPAGQSTLLLYNMGSSPVLVNCLQLSSTTGALAPALQPASDGRGYRLGGVAASASCLRGVVIRGGKKYVIR